MKNIKHTIAYFTFSLFISLGGTLAQPIYVSETAVGDNDGTSWENAYVSFQVALEKAKATGQVEEIWLAHGTYTPSKDISGNSSGAKVSWTFLLDFDVKIYGGFCGWETDIRERRKFLCPSILSGDHIGDDVYIEDKDDPLFPADSISDNSYNVMRMTQLTSASIIDGLEFIGGNASHPVTFSQRNGAAIWNDGASSGGDPTISNCVFEHNFAISSGGAICNYGRVNKTLPIIKQSIFRYNKSNHFIGGGGAILNDGGTNNGTGVCSPIISNCIFHDNFAQSFGGAILNVADNKKNVNPEIKHCTFSQNKSILQGGAIYSTSDISLPSTTTISSTIFGTNFTGNSSTRSFGASGSVTNISYSCYTESDGTNNNINSTPEFMSSSQKHFRLKPTSPCINVGEIASSNARDYQGLSRSANGSTSDMGAHEYMPCPASNIIYVDDTQYNSGEDGHTWSTAFTDLTDAIDVANACDSIPTIKIAIGMYSPTRGFNQWIPFGERNHWDPKQPMNIIGGYDDGGSVNPIQFQNAILTGDIYRDDNYSQFPSSNDEENIITLLRLGFDSHGSLIRNLDFTGTSDKYNNNGLEGAIKLSAGATNLELSIENCDFYYNSGHCIRNGNLGSSGEHSPTIEFCNFYNNYGSEGACIFNSGNFFPRIINCTFYDNEVATEGSAISTNANDVEGSIFVDQCKFYANTGRGAIFLKGTNSGLNNSLIQNSEFYDNTASSGAAIKNEGFFGGINTSTFINNTFYNNHASQRGGAVYNSISINGICETTYINCTFANNTANINGAGIFNSDGTYATIYNSIFWENHLNDQANSIVNESSSTADISFSLLEEVDCAQSHLAGTTCGMGMIYGQDPLFDPVTGQGFLRLTSASPAIDSGDSQYNTTFMDGSGFSARILNNQIDIGAHEFSTLCEQHLVLDINNLPFNGDSAIRGTWSASQSITIKNGFLTPSQDYLRLMAPEVIIEGSYENLLSSNIEINSIPCTNN